MKNLYIGLALLISSSVFGQIQQDVNKPSGTVSKQINDIDSIRFNASQNQMEIILSNGSVESHNISDVTDVTFSGQLPAGSISTLDCGGATIIGTIVDGVTANGVSATVDYTGGNGGTHTGQTVSSTGVTGLTATLAPGSFENGLGTLTYTITGTPVGIGTASFALNIGGINCILTVTVNPGAITTLDCAGATILGSLLVDVAASGISATVDYTGGNGGAHAGQVVNSTGITGLTATLAAGNFSNGNGSLIYAISGTALCTGTASFDLIIGGQTCTIELTVNGNPPPTVYCLGYETAVVEVTTLAGNVWMDRNLGASAAATSITDDNGYGNLYQWGRGNDGHQCRNSNTTNTVACTDQPNHGDFILDPSSWRNPQNFDLWQGVNGVNNPCPSGFRLPTEAEFLAEKQAWIDNGSIGPFTSTLKLPYAGGRQSGDGSLQSVGSNGYYWTSTLSDLSGTMYTRYFGFYGVTASTASMNFDNFAFGNSVRCIKH